MLCLRPIIYSCESHPKLSGCLVRQIHQLYVTGAILRFVSIATECRAAVSIIALVSCTVSPETVASVINVNVPIPRCHNQSLIVTSASTECQVHRPNAKCIDRMPSASTECQAHPSTGVERTVLYNRTLGSETSLSKIMTKTTANGAISPNNHQSTII